MQDLRVLGRKRRRGGGEVTVWAFHGFYGEDAGGVCGGEMWGVRGGGEGAWDDIGEVVGDEGLTLFETGGVDIAFV